MDYIRFAISNPVKVAVGVLLLILFGVLALFAIPIQLTPNVDQPVITVTTAWTGRSPQEVEREIIEEQEDKLKSVSDLKKMVATASTGRAEITLEFYVGANIARALQEVSDKLREVPEYPEEVDQPVITTADVAAENPIAWLILTADDPDFEIDKLKHVAEDRVKPYLERVAGVAEVRVYGGRDRQMHVQVDPRALAARGIAFNDFRRALQLENVNISAGELAQSERVEATVRTVGEYDDPQKILETIITYTEGGPIRVRDVATVELTLEKKRSFVRSRGEDALALPVYRETGSNVVQVMEALKKRMADVNRDILPTLAPHGIALELRQVYDETVYIYDALKLVLNNLWIGGALAIAVLLLFLHKTRPTGIVGLTIPVSVVGTFVAMTAAGRNLNVISLAGLAFAVGMVVDNAIVVLENIDRHLHMGKKPREAAYAGAMEVWGAIVASTLTTLAVFIPVLTIEEEAGQLFRDIALAICAAVSLSLIVSVTVIPSASARWLRQVKSRDARKRQPVRDAFRAIGGGLGWFFGMIRDAWAALIYKLSAPNVFGVGSRLTIVAVVTVAAVLLTLLIMPPASYLPKGNRNLVFGLIFTPPAYNIKQDRVLAERVEAVVRPYWEAKDYSDTARLPSVVNFQTGQTYQKVPPIENFFFVSFGTRLFAGAASGDKELVEPIGSLLTGVMNRQPAAFGFAQQLSIFGRGIGGSNAIEIEFKGTDLDAVRAAAGAMFGRLRQDPNYQNIQPDPGNFNLAAPELRVEIDRVRAANLGINVSDLGLGVQALIDGAVVGDYRLGGEAIDILLIRDPSVQLTPDDLGQIPVAYANPDGTRGQTLLSTIADIYWTDAPQQIKRVEELRAVVLTVAVPENMPLETSKQDLAQMVAEMRDKGAIPRGVEVDLAGNASKLTEVREAMLGSWHGFNFDSLKSLLSSRVFLALLVTYLLMAALFESFLYPFVIMFTVPLATVGGFIGLAIVHAFVPSQQLDVLTMLGFVILIGIVVNNAILIVHQALNFMRGVGETQSEDVRPMRPREAIRESVRSRTRPILMTTLTSVMGMCPLVLMPGAGSELYRGLGSVVLGGLLCATVFTLLVVPLLFSLMLDLKAGVLGAAGVQMRELEEVLAWEAANEQTKSDAARSTSSQPASSKTDGKSQRATVAPSAVDNGDSKAAEPDDGESTGSDSQGTTSEEQEKAPTEEAEKHAAGQISS